MLEVWSQSYHSKITQTASFLRKLLQDWNNMQNFQSSCGSKAILSFYSGLRFVRAQLLHYAVEEEAHAAVEMMSHLSRPSGESPPASSVLDRTLPEAHSDEGSNEDGNVHQKQEPPFAFHYLLAPAGSGKPIA
jgi:hypothetical protein